MNINQIAAFAVIARNGGAHTISPASMEVVPSLINDGYIVERPDSHAEPGYDLTEKGQNMTKLLVASTEYYEARVELKETTEELVEDIKAGTKEFIDGAKTKFNEVLDALKFKK